MPFVERFNEAIDFTHVCEAIEPYMYDEAPEGFCYDKTKYTFTMSKNEVYNAMLFLDKHKKCAKENPTTIGGAYSFIFTPTGIADTIEIRCNVCGDHKNITDYDNW